MANHVVKFENRFTIHNSLEILRLDYTTSYHQTASCSRKDKALLTLKQNVLRVHTIHIKKSQ